MADLTAIYTAYSANAATTGFLQATIRLSALDLGQSVISVNATAGGFVIMGGWENTTKGAGYTVWQGTVEFYAVAGEALRIFVESDNPLDTNVTVTCTTPAAALVTADLSTIKGRAVNDPGATVTIPASIASETTSQADLDAIISALATILAGEMTEEDFAELVEDAVDVSDTHTQATNAATSAAAVDSRLPPTPAAAGSAMTLTSVERTTLVAAVWNALIAGLTTANSIGKWLLDRLTPLPYSVLPYASTASDNGHLVPVYLTAYQYCKILASFAVTDASDDPVDLSGKSLSLVAWPSNAPATAGFELLNTGTSPALTVSGDDNNQVNIDAAATNTATAGDFDWTLYDMTNDIALANGTLRIIAGRAPAA